MSGFAVKRLLPHLRRPLFAALRGTAAALAALLTAEYFGIACPYWAAMTAIIVIQPSRGLLFEKSFYRLAGTAAGSLAALLLLMSSRSPLFLTIALCLWVAGCVGLGNVLYGQRSYACLMAGCTCVVIAMSACQAPEHLYEIAFGRVACIVVGIIFATIVTALFTPASSGEELQRRLDAVVADTLSWLALSFRQERGGDLAKLEQNILLEVADIETTFDVVSAGSVRLKKQARQLRSLLTAHLSLLAIGRVGGEHINRHHGLAGSDRSLETMARHLEELSWCVGYSRPGQIAAELSLLAADAKERFPLLGDALSRIVLSLQQVLDQSATFSNASSASSPFPYHRDWREASRAAARAALALAVIGLTWTLSGWVQGPLMIMAASIMVTIFSTKEHPVSFVGQIFLGASTGTALAVFCRSALLVGVTDRYLVAAVVAPFVCLGGFAMNQRRTAIAATDATLFFLFVVQPGAAFHISYHDLRLGGVAMILGVGLAWTFYRYLVPITPQIRLRGLLAAIISDVEKLASPDPPQNVLTLQTRMQHRVLRMVSLARRFDQDHLAVVEAGLAALAIATGIDHLREVEASGRLPEERAEILKARLYSLGCLSCRSGHGAEVLEQAANALYDALDPAFIGGPGQCQTTEREGEMSLCPI